MFRILFILFLLTLTACSNNKQVSPPVKITKSIPPSVQKLLSHYNEWRGVSYLIGGNTKKGIDCSGYVQLAFKQKLKKTLPRSTDLMIKEGKKISAKNRRPGDLVFFKTGWSIRHVGIYIGNNEFIHASTSRGVTKSNLSNPYWQKTYWMSRRY